MTAAAAGPSPTARLAPLDWMRGLVMILMAIDHSSGAFNGGHLFTDAAFLYRPGAPLPAAQFLTRWITHLCAPTFLFLAGVGLAFTVAKRRDRGASAGAIDRYILVRGVIIAAFELWISFFVMPKGKILFQVLYGIGSSYLFMIPLRRLPDRAAIVLGLALVVGGEALTGLLAPGGHTAPPLVLALLLTGASRPHLLIAYPTIPWLTILLLGWGWGRRLLTRPAAREGLAGKLALAGLVALLIFAVVRGVNGYGNMGLPRYGSSVVQWLHVSKYPPGLSYVSLELGIAALCMSGLFAFGRTHAFRPNGLVLTLGQTPMFFYLLHFPLLILSARILGVEHHLGLGAAYLGAALVVAALTPACRWYRGYKAVHRAGWAGYI
ncbi:MAG TPA: heparan-alpha-glucosaminide N-acetyltransferase domain-containing protein [Polyangia bacterium]|nr:heparan-alpha-glucosaminide N-acetyltransferase domain-containing protein [Polyangia bacterium]